MDRGRSRQPERYPRQRDENLVCPRAATGERVIASSIVMTYQEPSGGEQRVSFIAPAPLKPELTFLGDVLSKERGDESGDFNWIFLQAGREFSKRRPLPELFGIILDLCLEAVPAGRGVLLTLDERGGLVVQASRGGDIAISATVRDKVLSE